MRHADPVGGSIQSRFCYWIARFTHLSSLDTRFALVPNADLGHAQASLDATLDLRICRLFLLAAVLGGNILVLVVIGEVRAEEVRVRTVVFCNKVKCFGFFGE